MNEREFQDDLEFINEEEKIDFFDDSPYYHDPAYSEFNGWRDLV
jgi:hypothetical protein